MKIKALNISGALRLNFTYCWLTSLFPSQRLWLLFNPSVTPCPLHHIISAGLLFTITGLFGGSTWFGFFFFSFPVQITKRKSAPGETPTLFISGGDQSGRH